jgi:hypothetical protein
MKSNLGKHISTCSTPGKTSDPDRRVFQPPQPPYPVELRDCQRPASAKSGIADGSGGDGRQLIYLAQS